jgi:signal transduction histidine kinase/streptogramin lyase
MFHKRLYCSFALFAISCYALAQDTMIVQTELLTVKDGLSQGMISDIIQDKDGLLWFGTKDGLNKYDGYNFTVYRHQEDTYSLPGNYITGIVEDANGYIWVGTNTNGLCLFDKKNEKFYPVKLKVKDKSLSNNTVRPIQYQNGKLMIIDTRMIIYDIREVHVGNGDTVDLSKAPICFDNKLALPRNRELFSGIGIFNFNWMPDNSLWFLFDDSMFVFAPSAKNIFENIKSYSNSSAGLMTSELFSIHELPQPNRYLFLGINDLIVFDFGMNRIINKNTFDDRYPFGRGGQKDKYGNYFINGNSFYYFNSTDYSLKPVRGILGGGGICDRNGIFWAGTSGNGIIKYDYRKSLFLPVDRIRSVTFQTNNKGELWTLKNNIPYFTNPYTNVEHAILPPGIWNPDWVLRECITDKNGNVWIFYQQNEIGPHYLMSYNPATRIMHNILLPTYPYINPPKLILDKNDDLLLNTFDANFNPVLVRINKNTLGYDAICSIPAKSQNFFSYFISGYWQDSHDVFWFATLQGLYSFDEKKNKWNHWKNIPGDKSSLTNDVLLTITPDPAYPDKYLWVGSEGGGFFRFEIATGKFKNYSDKDGLPNNVVYGLLNDNAGNIWMSTNKGLSCFRPPIPGRGGGGEAFINFNSDDGLPGDEFNRQEYFKLPNGDLFFGGVEGGVIFNPEKVLAKEAAPNVVFTGLSVFNKPVTYKTDSNVIQNPIGYAKTITLPHDKGMFTISFAALEYRAASKKHYKYLLEGYDKNWIEAGTKNEATYTNLSPGKYKFRVIGAGRDDVWSKEASIQVIILPPWWATWWFRSLVAIALITLAYSFYRYRLMQALKLQAIRNRIASDLHDEIGSTLSSISLSSTIIQKKMNGNSTEVSGLLNQISSNTDNMMEAMSDIVWTINTKNDRFDNVINRMRAFAIEILEPKDCAVNFEVGKNLDDLALDMSQRKNLYLIFKEAINNAAKYAECKNVWIDISLKGKNKLVLKIKDDGRGFDPTPLSSTGRGAGGEAFGGNGLINMQQRASELNGKLMVDSKLGNGTEIILEINL